MASAAQVNAAKIKQLEAEAEYNLMLAAQARAETKKTGIEARRSELVLAEHERKEAAALAADQFHHRHLVGLIEAGSVATCIKQLTEWDRTAREPLDIEIVFNSPGGDVVEGFALYDIIQFVRSHGHRVTTSTIGMAASMAGVLLQAGDVRVMGSESWLMLHQSAFGVRGKSFEVEDRTEWVRKVEGRILDIFAARSKLSQAQLKRRWDRKEWWVPSDEALKLGLVDEVR